MVEVNGIGFSNKAIAFRVTIPDLPCANAKPHITICTINGGKPVDSNASGFLFPNSIFVVK